MAHKGHAFSVQIYRCSVEIDRSAHFRLFSVQIYRCSVQNWLLHTNIRSFSVQKLSFFVEIRCFSAQIECFSVENSIFLRTNQKLLRGKFDVSQYKSKVSPCKIRCFSVQIESDRKLLRRKLHSELGDLGSPPANKSLKLCFGEGMLCCL